MIFFKSVIHSQIIEFSVLCGGGAYENLVKFCGLALFSNNAQTDIKLQVRRLTGIIQG